MNLKITPKSFLTMASIYFYYTKSILESVSLNPVKFKKELKKASKNLLPFEKQQLHSWLVNYTIDRPELRQCI
jgi:hypothetical protein